jgi:hypothetical protein
MAPISLTAICTGRGDGVEPPGSPLPADGDVAVTTAGCIASDHRLNNLNCRYRSCLLPKPADSRGPPPRPGAVDPASWQHLLPRLAKTASGSATRVADTMRDKPRHLQPEYGAEFQDASAYAHRPPPPGTVLAVLLQLIQDEPRAVLDLGCGQGELARPLAAQVSRVGAVDGSAGMVAMGKGSRVGIAPIVRGWLERRRRSDCIRPTPWLPPVIASTGWTGTLCFGGSGSRSPHTAFSPSWDGTWSRHLGSGRW